MAAYAYAWLKEYIPDYFQNIQISRRSKLTLAVLAGISLSIVAGYLLRQRRKRYRPVAAKNSSRAVLHRVSTFREDPSKLAVDVTDAPLPSSEGTHNQLLVHQAREEHVPLPETADETCSVSSDDSFHSTVESLPGFGIEPLFTEPSPRALYLSGLKAVSSGAVSVRTIRTQVLLCASNDDFLAKVYCVRLAFDHLVKSPDHRAYFITITRNLMSDFLEGAGESPQTFCERFDDLVHFMQDETSWAIATEELTQRRVGAMNVYDIGVDFTLLDAFDDLESPPSAFLSVLQNRWITTGMKKSALNAALWSVLKAKKSLLQHKDGFMTRFYALSETITPSLAWGFLGTDDTLKATCIEFKTVVLKFFRSVFSMECVRYTTVGDLSEDVLRLAQEAAETMHTFHHSN